MHIYFNLLLWTAFLYFLCWFDNNVRRETILYEINEKLAKILGFMKNGRRSSIFSIILGLYAHISLILLVVLGVYIAVIKVNINLEYIALIWLLFVFILGFIGSGIEVYINIKMAERLKQKIEFIILVILLFISLCYLIYLLSMVGFRLIRNWNSIINVQT